MLPKGETVQRARKFLVELVSGRGETDEPDSFEQVLAAEREEITESRRRRYDNHNETNDRETYVGLALSGGGIRSATFSLGVLQAMHDLGALRTVDYLSTVSGGGFSGSWWTAWLQRQPPPPEGQPVPPDVYFPPREQRERERAPDLTPGEDLPDGARFAGIDPIHHLRLFANYLTPRKGLLSSDSWRAAAVFSRNLTLTWLVLLPILCGVVLIGQLYFVLQPFSDQVAADFVHASVTSPLPDVDLHRLDDMTVLWERVWVAARPLLALFALMVWVTGLWMHYNNAGSSITHAATLAALVAIVGSAIAVYDPGLTDPAQWSRPGGSFFVAHRWDILLGVLTLVAAVGIERNIRHGAPEGAAVTRQVKGGRATTWHATLLTAFAAGAFVLAFAGFSHEVLIVPLDNLLHGKFEGWKEWLTAAGAAIGVVSTVYTALVSAPSGGRDKADVAKPSFVSRLVLAASPPIALVLLAGLAAVLMHKVGFHIILRPDRLPPLSAAAWAGLALAVFLAWWENKQLMTEGVRLPVVYLLATALIVSTLGFSTSLPARWHYDFPVYARWGGIVMALAVGTGLFTLSQASARVRGLLGATVSLVVVWMFINLPGFDDVWASGPDGNRESALHSGFALLGAMSGWILALGWMADPNALSLHTFYKMRLVRAYLGASNKERRKQSHDIADPDPSDDVTLASLRNNSKLGGPYHLVNATLNLVGGRDLITAQRSAASFVMGARYCGSLRTGFRPTDAYMRGALTLGAAVATSGAAVSPNMGSATPSAALALLLGALNVRLGLWVPTPSRGSWPLPQTRLWPYYLLRESLSQTNDLGSYCYLTDGGHFDNTGLYSLIERGCRYIVLVDNGADPEACFADVGEAIRRCRIDFRAEIVLDTRIFRPVDNATVAVHVVCGRIRYDEGHLRRLGWTNVNGRQALGRLVWIKPIVLPTDSGDVRQYKLENREFPQQSTADQWFDESQFESYRKLGELSGRAAFCPATLAEPLGRRLRPEDVEQFFSKICPYQIPLPDDGCANF
jgi:hypothetical protein